MRHRLAPVASWPGLALLLVSSCASGPAAPAAESEPASAPAAGPTEGAGVPAAIAPSARAAAGEPSESAQAEPREQGEGPSEIDPRARAEGAAEVEPRALAEDPDRVDPRAHAGGSGEVERRADAPSASHEAGTEIPSRAPDAAGRRGPWTVELRLENAAYDAPGAPSVVVHAPPRFDPARPLRLAVFLHGWSGCARVLALAGSTPCRDGERAREGWGLADRFDAAGSDALFVVPQLAFLRRSGDPGQFAEEGRFAAFVREMLDALAPRLGADPQLEALALLAHSAGFESALALLARGGVEVSAIVLFDALYRGVEPFLDWAAAAPGRRLVSLYTGGGRTATQSRMLARRARALLGASALAYDASGPLGEQIRAHRVVVARSSVPHAAVPAHHMAEIIGALGFSARP